VTLILILMDILVYELIEVVASTLQSKYKKLCKIMLINVQIKLIL